MAGTVMLAYYFEYTDTFAVNVQGFFCYESAYRKPYPGPEESSAVPPVLLYSLAAGGARFGALASHLSLDNLAVA
ncbi:UNVERIFIED_CONTAM: Phospholipid phosphatase- protein type 5 [Gekko kuhli]